MAAQAEAADAAPFVIFETSLGAFSVELYSQHAPQSCKNFRELARTGYYDSTTFHRVIRGFMAQGGDPTGTGRGGESIYGGKFRDEITRELKHVGAGVLAMANSGPHTNGSQFYITLAPAPWLDGKHSIFGRVAPGMGAVRKLGMVPVDANDRPSTTITVRRAYPSMTSDLPLPSTTAAIAAGAPMGLLTR